MKRSYTLADMLIAATISALLAVAAIPVVQQAIDVKQLGRGMGPASWGGVAGLKAMFIDDREAQRE